MTDLVQELIETCAARGVEINETDAAHVLLARKILARDPENLLAKEVLQNFGTQLATGKAPESFTGFMLRDPDAA